MAAQRNKDYGDAVPDQSTDSVQEVAIRGMITVSAHRTFKINLGGYESADISHRIEYAVDSDSDMELVAQQLSEQLDILQTNDLNLAAEQSNERKSFIHKLLK